jgi:hypothetical protein
MAPRADRRRRALSAALLVLPALAGMLAPGATARAQATGTSGRPAPSPPGAAATASGGPIASALDLSALMALLAQRKSGEARFTEERFVATFDSPLRSAGVLSFSAPDRFARHTLEPRPESMELAGSQLTLRRSGRTQRMAVDTLPELGALLEAVRGTLTGDAGTLRRHFTIVVGGSAEIWTLTLAPRDARLAGQVRQVQIVGQGADPRSVELQLAGGDRSLMLIEPLQPAGALRDAPSR